MYLGQCVLFWKQVLTKNDAMRKIACINGYESILVVPKYNSPNLKTCEIYHTATSICV